MLGPLLIDDVLAHAASRAPSELALVTDAGSVTFADLERRVDRAASALGALGPPGTRVAVLAENRAEYVELYYAVPRAGQLLVPVNHRLHPDEWGATLRRSGADILVGEPELLARLADPGGSTVVSLGTENAPTGARIYDELVAEAAPFVPQGGRAPDDVIWLLGTSGTTGSPKLAKLTHASLLAAADATLTARPVNRHDVLLTPFPLCHVAGYNVFVVHRAARPLVLMRRFVPRALAVLVREHDVTQLSLAPTMIAMLLDAPDVDDADLATIRSLGYGASPIPGPVLRRLVERWDWDCSQGYGMTELSGNGAFLGPDEHRRAAAGDERLLTAAGRPAPGVELTLAPRTGEILVRAPQVMAGYWDDPTASAAALRGGWLHTGDVGRIDDDGIMSVIDRLKDVIVSGGENVASREVEDVLLLHPGVAEVAVVGRPDERWGERVCAFVVARPAAGSIGDALTAELPALAREHLAGFKVPREVIIVDALPRNATGKVLKDQLRDSLAGRSPNDAP